MMWMPYICVIAFAVAAAAPRYQQTALIMCGAFALDIVLDPYYVMLHSYLIASFTGFVDGIVAFAVLKYGSKGAVWQAYVLLAALSVNIILLVDLLMDWDLVYSVYQEAIFVINAIAILMMGGAYGDLIQLLKRSYNRRFRVGIFGYFSNALVGHRRPHKGAS